ncbi:hypothetical protein IMCC26256_111818 [Actinobacteria bacterium IMCC26256]|nr:hypothetical protein IMCC26256_111818 [Actinobacteria bacterium IMCC26256]
MSATKRSLVTGSLGVSPLLRLSGAGPVDLVGVPEYRSERGRDTAALGAATGVQPFYVG